MRDERGVPTCGTQLCMKPTHGTLSGRPPAAQQDLLEELVLRLVVLLHLRGSRRHGEYAPQPAR